MSFLDEVTFIGMPHVQEVWVSVYLSRDLLKGFESFSEERMKEITSSGTQKSSANLDLEHWQIPTDDPRNSRTWFWLYMDHKTGENSK